MKTITMYYVQYYRPIKMMSIYFATLILQLLLDIENMKLG